MNDDSGEQSGDRVITFIEQRKGSKENDKENEKAVNRDFD